MNKLMLFKAWDKWKNKMIQPNEGDFFGWKAMSNWRDCLEVLQYTGSDDVNGNRIFASDNVVQTIAGEHLHKEDWERVSGTVKMIDGCWCVGEYRYPLYAFPCVLVGNAFEDPDFEFKVEEIEG